MQRVIDSLGMIEAVKQATKISKTVVVILRPQRRL